MNKNISVTLLLLFLFLFTPLPTHSFKPPPAEPQLGEGSTLPFPLYSRLIFGWDQLNSANQLSYAQTTSVRGLQTITGPLPSPRRYWAAADVRPTAQAVTAAASNRRALAWFPSAMISLIPFANYASLQSSQAGLQMTAATLALIWIGNISAWNDPRLVATNPQLSAVDRPILLVTPNATAGSLSILQQALLRHLPQDKSLWPFPWFVNGTWSPQHLAALGQRVRFTAVGNPAAFAKVSETPYSIGTVSQSLLFQMGVNFSQFRFLSPAPQLAQILPDPPSLLLSSQNAALDPRTGIVVDINASQPPSPDIMVNASELTLGYFLTSKYIIINNITNSNQKKKHGSNHQNQLLQNINNNNSDLGWPIYGYTYIYMDLNLTVYDAPQCEALSELFKFFRWFLADQSAHTEALSLGVVIVRPAIAEAIAAWLSSLRCDDPSRGPLVLQLRYEDQRQGATWDAMLSLAMVCLLFPLCLGGAALHRMHHNDKRRGFYFFLFNTLLGAVLLLLAVIFFWLVPDENFVCVLRTWFVGVGFTLLVVPIVSKIVWCLAMVRLSEDFRSTELSLLKLAVPLTVMLCLQILLLILWAAIDPYSSATRLTDEYALVAIYYCTSEDNWIWFGIEIGWLVTVCVVSFALYISNSDKRVRQMHDVSWSQFTIYNILVFMIIIIPLLAGFTNGEEAQYFIISIGLILPAVFTCMTLYGPLVLPSVFKAFGTNFSRHSSKVSSGSSTPTPTAV